MLSYDNKNYGLVFNMMKNQPRSAYYIFLSLLGLRLLDPIEVYYIPKENLVYPIISKSGCSTLKLLLIRKYRRDYENTFPEIHLIDPDVITGGLVKRQIFYDTRSYTEFIERKNLIIILRDPISRFVSMYNGVVTGKNNLYKYPYHLHGLFSFTKNLTIRNFAKLISFIPDRLADRHIRSQSFYIPKEVGKIVESIDVISMKSYFEKAKVEGNDFVLNKGGEDWSKMMSGELKKLLKNRYRQDFINFK